MKKQDKYRVVLIADRVQDFQSVTIETDNLEFTEEAYFQSVYNTLKVLCRDVVFYDDPAEFINQISKHKNDLVLSLWSGQKSRNRRALIPSICEAYKIKYIGADTYANIICQDKAMSKEFCKKFGMKSANYELLNGESDLSSISHLSLPLVVKPNFEGGSIGISQDNLTNSYENALEIARKLYGLFNQEIMVEEFIPGREINIVISGTAKQIKFCEAIEIVLDDGKDGLSQRLYSYEIKKENETGIYYKLITNEIPSEIINQAKKIFSSLGKLENLRIDGRFDGTVFTVIELSPDIYYGPAGTFAQAFLETGSTLEEMFSLMIDNATI